MKCFSLPFVIIAIAPLAAATDYTVSSWSQLHSAWGSAGSGDRILIPANTTIEVPETLDFLGRALTVVGLDPQTSVLAVAIDPVPVGWQGNRIFLFSSGEGHDSSVHNLVLRGRLDLPNGKTMEKGGLVYIESRLQHEVPGDNTTPIITIETSPRFTNVHFEDSRVTARGGAVLLDVATNGLNPTTPFRYPAPLFEDCLFTGNRASDLGGAVYAGGGYGSMTTGGARAVFDDCRFEGNFAANGGGAVCVGSAVVELNNCLFTDNTLLEDWANGSAVLMANFISLSDLVMKNCTATGNVGQYTIFHNAGLGLGGSLRILNSIVWGNTSNTSFFQSIGDNGSFSSVDVEYSDIEMSSGIYPGMGNQNLNPFFQGDSFLDQVSSPCIDAGDPATAGAGRLHSKTTAQTAVNDLGLVDMGYHHAGGDNPRFYGVGNADYSGDRAWIDYSGAPVAGGTFIAQLRGARPNSTGVLLYGYAEDAKPISRGTLWVSLPSPMLLIRGDVDATGSLDMDLSSYIVSGQRVYLQFLYAKNLGAVGKRSFTDAMEVTVQ